MYLTNIVELYMHNEGLNFVNRSYLFLNNFEQNYVDQLEKIYSKTYPYLFVLDF